jgi:hypothetical protein
MAMTQDLQMAAPYLAERATATVFLDARASSTTFPEDEEGRRAIGLFVDDYFFALKMLVPKTLNEVERKRRTELAWIHAVESLSEGQMSREEATRYWQSDRWSEDIEFWPHKDNPKSNITEWPTVPSVEDPSEVVEWNVLPHTKAEIKTRKLEELTYADVSKEIWSLRRVQSEKISGKFESFSAHIPGQNFEEAAIWSRNRRSRAQRVPAMREGQILSALLFIDTSNSAKTRILSSPFPSRDDVRYPATYLGDDDFWQQEVDDALFSTLVRAPGIG